MHKKQSWDDIPSLEIETDDPATNDLVENRRSGRLSTEDIKKILLEKIEVIKVRVASTNRGIFPDIGVMEDVHAYGMGFSMSEHGLNVDEIIAIGTVIGNQRITSEAIVRWVKGDKIGIEFLDAGEESVTFLKDLYSAKIFQSWV